jgi:hypothetical protein
MSATTASLTGQPMSSAICLTPLMLLRLHADPSGSRLLSPTVLYRALWASNGWSLSCRLGDVARPDLGRPIAAALGRCTELRGVDLATVREVTANVEPRT